MIAVDARFVPRILAALVGLAAGGMLMALVTAYSTVSRLEVERLRSTVDTILVAQRERIAELVLDYASWDDAWQNLVQSPDTGWAVDNIGPWLTQEHNVVTVLVTGADGGTRLLVREGRLLPVRLAPPELAPVVAWAAARDMAEGPKARTIWMGGRAMHVATAAIVGHTEAVAPLVGESPDRLIFIRPAELEEITAATDGWLTAMSAAEAPPADQVGTLSAAKLVFPQPGIAAADGTTLVVEAPLSGRLLLIRLGLPIAGVVGLLIGLAWWAGTLALQEHGQRRLLAAQRAELLESREALVRSAETKARYHRMMAHELRSPLSVIVAAAQMLSGGGQEQGEERRERQGDTPSGGPGDPGRGGASYARFIAIAAAQLQAMVDDLLDLARVQAGALDLSPEAVRVPDLVDRVVEALQPQARETGLVLRAGDVLWSAEIQADPRVLERVIYNLVNAGLREAPNGTEIALGAESCGRELRIRLEGRDADGRPVDLPMKRDGRLGLGLPFCEAMLAEMGGRLDLVETPGRPGTEAAIVLPVTA